MPSFWLALMLQFLFFSKLGWLPDGQRLPIGVDPPGQITTFYTVDALLHGDLHLFWVASKHLLLPAAVLGYGSLAVVTRMVRGGMLEILGQDYIKVARSKGLSERAVLGLHALRVAWPPILTISGLQLGYLLGGAVFTEEVFGWPGLGRQLVSSVIARDVQVVQGAALFIALASVIVNLVVDLLNLYLDPRSRPA